MTVRKCPLKTKADWYETNKDILVIFVPFVIQPVDATPFYCPEQCLPSITIFSMDN